MVEVKKMMASARLSIAFFISWGAKCLDRNYVINYLIVNTLLARFTQNILLDLRSCLLKTGPYPVKIAARLKHYFIIFTA